MIAFLATKAPFDKPVGEVNAGVVRVSIPLVKIPVIVLNNDLIVACCPASFKIG